MCNNQGLKLLTCLIAMSIVAIQAVVYGDPPIVLSAEEISDANTKFEKHVNLGHIADDSPHGKNMELLFGIEWLKKDSKVKEWDMAAVGAFFSTLDAMSTKFDLMDQKPWIVMMVGVGNTGGVGVSVVELLLRRKFEVLLLVLPRYKTDVIKDKTMDALWEEHLKAIQDNEDFKLDVLDLRKIDESMAATKLIKKVRIAISSKSSDITRRKEKLTQSLVEEAKVVKMALQELSTIFSTIPIVVIESYVGAGYQHKDEVDNKHVLRYDLGNAVGEWLSDLVGVFIGSLDLPCNTSTEHGYFHVTKDGQMNVSPISKSYIPGFMVLISYPRESLLALEGTGDNNMVQYQFQTCSLIYLSPFVDTLSMNVSMSLCISEAVKARSKILLKYTETEVNAFFAAMAQAESKFGTEEGFLKLTLPNEVTKTLSRTAGIYRPVGTPNNRSGKTIDTAADAELVKEWFLEFDDYAQLFVNMGNRMKPIQL